MKIYLLLIFTLLLSGSCSYKLRHANIDNNEITYLKKDKKILNKVSKHLEKYKDKDISELVVLTGKYFLKTPYVAHTLEAKKEQLVINLREFDCTTYAENCLAISRTVKSGSHTFEQFATELKLIRYRQGIIDDYPSRLHYFSDWIYDNDGKELIKDVSQEIANIPLTLHVKYMSTHPHSYPQIKSNERLVSIIAEQERNISLRQMFYIPKNRLAEFENKLQDGDIVGITTSIDGMDIQHVGILIEKLGRIHLMHASSQAEKVIVSEETLEKYLLNNKRATGIMVARP